MQYNTLDSRAIGYTDIYGQRFMREGSFRYGIVPAPAGELVTEYPCTIEVAGGSNETMTQHLVELTADGKSFKPPTDPLVIENGDLVTWVCRNASAPPFEVVGEREFFRSARLTNESGYGHAFGSPGEYAWSDVHGSGVGGVVRVRDPKADTAEHRAEWLKTLESGALVMISGDSVEPAELEIVTGQTVYFAVTKSSGISITDRRLADSHAGVRREQRARTAFTQSRGRTPG